MNSTLMIHNSWDKLFREPFGAVECDKEITIRFQIATNNLISYVKLIVFNEKMSSHYTMNIDYTDPQKYIFKYIIKAPDEPCLLFYCFEVCVQNEILYYGNNYSCLGGIGDIYKNSPMYYQITVFQKNYSTPNWFKHSVMYQIFVDRFFNGNENNAILNIKKNSFIYGCWNDSPMYIKDVKNNEILRWDFYGGNLLGIIKKLDYLNELGINLIYLNPIFEARSNHKYDTGNYKKIDPMFGDDKTFKKLIKECKMKNINLILDGVFSHTGSDSIYFNKYKTYSSLGAYESTDSKYHSWYKFKVHPNEYDCWWGVKDLPNVNEMDESYLNYIIRDDDSVIKYWMSFGIKGWRLDVADELPDEFIQEIKTCCSKIDNSSILLGEVWEDASNKISYNSRRKYFSGKELDSVTNYIMRDCLLNFLSNNITASILYKKFMSLYENYPIHNFYSLVNILGTHDVERIYSSLKEIAEKNYIINSKDILFKLLKIVTLIQFTFPGIPLIYYGDEVGVEGLKDPYNRSTYPWGNENLDILNWYKSLIHIRNNNVVLRTGEWQPLYFGDNVYGYIRYIKNNKDCFNKNENNAFAVILINKSINESYNIKINTDNFDVFNLTNALYPYEKLDCVDNCLYIPINPLEEKLYITS